MCAGASNDSDIDNITVDVSDGEIVGSNDINNIDDNEYHFRIKDDDCNGENGIERSLFTVYICWIINKIK